MLSMLCSSILAADDKETLRGIRGFNVVVEQLPRVVDRSGTRREEVKNLLEARLRKAGLKILSEDEALSQSSISGYPYLYVYTDITPYSKGDFFVYHIVVELRQRSTLMRDPSLSVYTATWSRSRCGAARKYRWKELQNDIVKLLNEFIDDFREVNPK